MYSSTGDVDGVGSTKLHLDVSSAVNILVHTSGEGLPGARWHIFLAADTAKLRAYLRAKSVCSAEEDPIHAQGTYLTPSMLAELKQHGVRPFEVQQKLGDAIFIPAGCAHQVSSFTSGTPITDLAIFLGQQYFHLYQNCVRLLVHRRGHAKRPGR